MNKLLIPLLVVSIAGNVYLFFSLEGGLSKPQTSQIKKEVETSKNVETQKQDRSGADSIIKDLDQKLQQSRALVTSLKRKNLELENKLADLKMANIVPNSKSELTESSNDSEKREGAKTVEELKEERRRIRTLFEKENVDQDWAYPTQDNLSDLISNSELLAQMSVNQIICKTSSCRLSVTPLQEGMGAKIGAYFELSQLLHENEQFKNYQSSSRHDEESNDVYIYLERPDSEG